MKRINRLLTNYHLLLLFFLMTTVTMNAEEVYIGHSIPLKISYLSTYTASNFHWTASNDNVEIVSTHNGECEIRGMKEGKSTVTCSYRLTGIKTGTVENKSVSFYITVRPGSDDITITPKRGEIAVGETLDFKAEVRSYGVSYTMDWTSDKPSIAKVVSKTNKSCVVEGVSAGTAYITAKTSYGSQASFPVTVYTSPTGVKVSTASGETVVYIGWFVLMQAELIPSNSRSSITWSVDDTSVAIIEQTGYLMTLKPGIVNVTATTDNGKQGTMTLEVRDHPFDLVSSIPINNATDVPLDVQPRMNFSTDVEMNFDYSKFKPEYIRLENVDDGYTKVERELHIEGASVWIVPKEPLLPCKNYRFIINVKYLKSVSTGEPNSKDYCIHFKTVDPPLTLVRTSPRDGATEVPVGINPKMVFSDMVSTNYDTPGFDYNNFTLKADDGSVVARQIEVNGETYLMRPYEALKPNTRYTMTIPASHVKKTQTGIPSTEDFSFSFTTASESTTSTELEGTFAANNIKDGILIGNTANFVIAMTNPTTADKSGLFGFYYYSGEEMALGYTWWPSENKNEIIVSPGTNTFLYERGVDSTFPCKFVAYYYPENGERVELGSIVINGKTSTGINSIFNDATPFDIYDLQGRKVRTKTVSTDGLPKGIYIINGKKIII